MFAILFRRPAGRLLLAVYVCDLFTNVPRTIVEALAQRVAVRTLQRLLESIQWDEERPGVPRWLNIGSSQIKTVLPKQPPC